MVTQSVDTRLALLRAAERLFAQDGIDSVSLRRIAAEAGQGNHSAVLYHFADKKDLVNALLERHSSSIEAGWTVAVQHLAAEGRDTLPELVGLMVRPLVAKLDDPDGGTDYLLVVAQLVTSRSFPLAEMPATMAPGILALTAAMMGRMERVPDELMPLRMMRVAAALYCSIADFHRMTAMGMEIDRGAFVDDLIASLTGLIGSDPRQWASR